MSQKVSFEQVTNASSPDRISAILALMPLYYADDHLEFDLAVARRAIGELVVNPGLGQLWLIRSAEEVVGYFAIVFSYSLEFGGKTALIDELFALEAFRGKGLGTQAIKQALAECRQAGANTVRLEVTPTNARALKLYERLGFKNLGRSLLTYQDH